VSTQSASEAPAGVRSQPASDGADQASHRNEVVLVGRLAAAPQVRTLPSGDVLATFRLVVARPPVSRGRSARVPSSRPVAVDALDCVSWRASVRRTVTGWVPGDVVEVTGSLRRRFWRAGAGTASRCEVEVAGARRLRRAAG